MFCKWSFGVCSHVRYIIISQFIAQRSKRIAIEIAIDSSVRHFALSEIANYTHILRRILK